MQNYYQFLIPRMNGDEIEAKFPEYLSLVKKGIAGFIVFGGELRKVRSGLKKLQSEAALPLIIASDLERGLGQQLRGGTLFPPAMALAFAVRRKRGGAGSAASAGRLYDLPLLRRTLRAMAEEARYAGINAVLAPVLDINTNPRNPIIATRSFGEDSDTVTYFGHEMIRAFQESGLAACGKHFPGHGDTAEDSHIKLPLVRKTLRALERNELKPFVAAARAGVKMIMLGHLSVPALDPSRKPVSLSKRAVSYLRDRMKYNGILITDAMNMGGIGRIPEETAALSALQAGVDLILHPSHTEKVVSLLKKERIHLNGERLTEFRRSLESYSDILPRFDRHRRLADLLAGKSVVLTGVPDISARPFLLILNDEDEPRGDFFLRVLKAKLPDVTVRRITSDTRLSAISLPGEAIVVAVFSEIKGWKGGASPWLRSQLKFLGKTADLFISFGSPYIFRDITRPTMRVFSDSEASQKAAAELTAKLCRPAARPRGSLTGRGRNRKRQRVHNCS